MIDISILSPFQRAVIEYGAKEAQEMQYRNFLEKQRLIEEGLFFIEDESSCKQRLQRLSAHHWMSRESFFWRAVR